MILLKILTGLKKITSKEHWGVESNWQVFIIFIVFAITGSLSVKLADVLTQVIGLDMNFISPWLFWPIRILLIFPIYQLLLIIVGTLFGQHKFFWRFTKKMLKRIGFRKIEV